MPETLAEFKPKPIIELNSIAKPKARPKPEVTLSIDDLVNSNLWQNFCRYEASFLAVELAMNLRRAHANLKTPIQQAKMLSSGDLNKALTWSDHAPSYNYWANAFHRCESNRKHAIAALKQMEKIYD
jgi:hypothetical protein